MSNWLADHVFVECQKCRHRQRYDVLLKSGAELTRFIRVTFPDGFLCPACEHHNEKLSLGLHVPQDLFDELDNLSKKN